MRLFGSLAVLDDVFFFFMPSMRAQNDLRLAADLALLAASAFLTGGFRLPPVDRLYEARPAALRPPLGFLPAARVQAGVLAVAFFLAAITCPCCFCGSGQKCAFP